MDTMRPVLLAVLLLTGLTGSAHAVTITFDPQNGSGTSLAGGTNQGYRGGADPVIF